MYCTMNKLVFLGLIPVLMAAIPNVYASDDPFRNSQGNRPAINEAFDPDRSCMFDAYQLKCIPGSQQECPDDFGRNEDSTCVYPHSEGCPEGYHTTDDDETGQCYDNDEGCNGYMTKDGVRYNYVLIEGEDGKGDRCRDPAYLCNEEPDHPACKDLLTDEGPET